jgi:hypothetical protein
MLQLSETTLFHWDTAVDFLYRRAHDPKKAFSGTKKVNSWIAKLQTTAPLASQPPTQGSSASARSYVTTIANTNRTPSSGSQCPTTPVWSSSNRLGYRVSDLEASEGMYCHAVEHLTNLSKRFPSPVSDSMHLIWFKPLTHCASSRTSSKYSQLMEDRQFQTGSQIKPQRISRRTMKSTLL